MDRREYYGFTPWERDAIQEVDVGLRTAVHRDELFNGEIFYTLEEVRVIN